MKTDKNNSIFRVLIYIGILLFAFFMVASDSYAATYYVDDNAADDAAGDGSVGNPKKYITSGIQLLSGGDTLIIKDGTYTGQNNMIGDYADPRVYPPSGLDSTHYTIIKAENIGQAIIDAEYLWGSAFSNINEASNTGPLNYIRIEGIHFKRGKCGVFNLTGDYNKVIRSGFEDGQDSASDDQCAIAFIGAGSTYSLVEDCWVWGKGRIGFFTSSLSSGGTTNVIFRRLVVRQDDTPVSWVSAGILFYKATNNVCQNCIVIDSTPATRPAGNEYLNTGAFETVRYADSTSWLGSIALNNTHYKGFHPEDTSGTTTIDNTIFWENGSFGFTVMSNSAGTFDIDHVTNGGNQAVGYKSYNGFPTIENVSNSIAVNNSGHAFDYITSVDTVNVFGNTGDECNGCTITNNVTTSPFVAADGFSSRALKYLPRIEDSSNLKGEATDGGDIGATIMKRIGVSETLYGETGWNDVTNDDLWPWPDQQIWTPKLRAYTASGSGGNRGFATSTTGLYGGQVTLTSYIWEYLGNACPSDICDYPPSPPQNLTAAPE